MYGNVRKTRWKLVAAIGLVAAGTFAGWQIAIRATAHNGPPTNAIMVIAPYWYNGTWVFDDPAAGLKCEPFVAGVPEMIDGLVKNIPDVREGFRTRRADSKFHGIDLGMQRKCRCRIQLHN